MVRRDLHPREDVRTRHAPLYYWYSAAGGHWLYRFANDWGAVVTDRSEYGTPANNKTVKLVWFTGPDNEDWEPREFLHSHQSDLQVEAVLDHIQKGDLKEQRE